MAGCPGQDAIRQSRIHVLHLSIIRAVHLDVAFFPVCDIRYRDGHSAIAVTVESVFFPDGGGDFVDWVAALFRLVLQLDDHAGGLINLGRLGRHIVPGRVADGQSAHAGFQFDFLHLLILIDGVRALGPTVISAVVPVVVSSPSSEDTSIVTLPELSVEMLPLPPLSEVSPPL